MSEKLHQDTTVAEKIRISLLSTLLSGTAMYGYMDIASSRILDDDEIAQLAPSDTLGRVDPCAQDPLKYTVDRKRFVVADSRCRNTNSKEINVMKTTSEAALGPIASVDGAVPLRAICATKGAKAITEDENFSSDVWVRVHLDQREGIVYKSSLTEGYVSALDVVAEDGLPFCNGIDRETINFATWGQSHNPESVERLHVAISAESAYEQSINSRP